MMPGVAPRTHDCKRPTFKTHIQCLVESQIVESDRAAVHFRDSRGIRSQCGAADERDRSRTVTGRQSVEENLITLGVEEEFFLVNPETRDLLTDPDPAIFKACEDASGLHKVVREVLRTQIETNTRVCHSVAELRGAMCETRRIVVRAAEQYGAAVMASSTHPFALWQEQEITPKQRYEAYTVRLQDIVRRFLVGGMHIHAGFADADTRIRVMTALRRYLPVLHALSTSSPFSDGRETGFKSWRLTVVCGLPRTGMPAPLGSHAAYERLVGEYQRMKFINDGSELWWDIRPSHTYPTLELRICDVCTRLEDAVCIAALYAALIRMLVRRDKEGQLTKEPLTEMIVENRWIAQRYGVFAFFGDCEREGGRVDIDDLVKELVEELAEDASALGCESETRRALDIVRDGTAADRQIDLYRLRLLEGDTEAEALSQVVDAVLAETRQGIGEGLG